MGSAPGPRPLFCKKAGQKTFRRQSSVRPKPLALGASESIRPRSGHLSGRVAPPTRVGEAGGSRNLTGAPPPQKRFSLGLHPVSLGKTKEMGVEQQHKVKTNRQQNGELPPTHPTGGPPREFLISPASSRTSAATRSVAWGTPSSSSSSSTSHQAAPGAEAAPRASPSRESAVKSCSSITLCAPGRLPVRGRCACLVVTRHVRRGHEYRGLAHGRRLRQASEGAGAAEHQVRRRHLRAACRRHI